MNIETTDNSPLLQECIEELINSKIDEGKGRNAGNKSAYIRFQRDNALH